MNFSLHFSYNFLTCPRVNYRNQYKHLNNDLSSSSKCFGFTRFPSWAIVYISADRPQISDVNSINISSRDPLWKKSSVSNIDNGINESKKGGAAVAVSQEENDERLRNCGQVFAQNDWSFGLFERFQVIKSSLRIKEAHFEFKSYFLLHSLQEGSFLSLSKERF